MLAGLPQSELIPGAWLPPKGRRRLGRSTEPWLQPAGSVHPTLGLGLRAVSDIFKLGSSAVQGQCRGKRSLLYMRLTEKAP